MGSLVTGHPPAPAAFTSFEGGYGASDGGFLERMALLAEFERNGYKYFVPNGAQEQFIRAVGGMMSKRIFLFSSANAVGKTSAVVNILANIFWDNENEFFQFERFDRWPYPKNFWYASEHTTLKEAVAPEVEKWFPADRYKLIKNSGYPIHLETDTGFQIDFKRYDQDAKKYESATLGGVIMDEPPREAVYNACISRLRLGGVVIMPMTPLFSAAFIKDKIVDDNADAYVQFADMEENCEDHGIRGMLKHKDIQFMIDQMDSDEKDARVHGKFMFLSGLIFKEFNRKYHSIRVDDIEQIWKPELCGNFENWPKMMLIDPHDRRPDAIAWAAVAPDDSWIIYDEYPDLDFYKIKSRTDDIKAVVRAIRDKEDGRTVKSIKALLRSGERLKIFKRVMDRRKGGQNVSDENKTLRELYNRRSEDIGFPLDLEASYDDGNKIDHKIVRDALLYEVDAETGFYVKRPKLYVLEDCRNTIFCMEHYSWDDFQGSAAEKRALSERIQDKYKDYIDLIRYLLGEEIGFKDVFVSPRTVRAGGYDDMDDEGDGDSWLAA